MSGRAAGSVRDARDVEEAVRDALAGGQTLEIVGHGTKRALGRPMSTNAMLDLSALDGVTLYEPNELVLTVQAGAPLASVQALLEKERQELAFEPMNVAALLGGSQARGTIGGTIGAALAGPRRIKAGGARDHVLGFCAVSGFGETFKAGGRVVKNVTGYDLCKLLTGSWGTLAVMTELTLKVLPRAETELSLALRGLDELAAGRAMITGLGSAFDVSGAAHLPAVTAGDIGAALGAAGQSVTLLRLEGIAASVSHRAQALGQLLRQFGPADQLGAEASRVAWAAVRDVCAFARSGPFGEHIVWRIVCPPAAGAALGQGLCRDIAAAVVYDWGGGLIWAALPPSHDGQAGPVRTQARAAGGHAMLIRAGDRLRDGADVFEPAEPALAALQERVRASFDPKAIFNRGRLMRHLTS